MLVIVTAKKRQSKWCVWQKTKYKDADGLRQAVISDLLENHLRAVALAFIKKKWRIVVRLF
jgi:predicted DNA binding CopG/RHH family protein